MRTDDSMPTATGVTERRLAGLRRWNLALTALHLAQAVLVVVLAGDFAITVTSSVPAGPPGTAAPAPEALFDVPIGWAIAVFLLLAALDHLLTGTVSRRTYERDLRRGINRFRWVEYSVSATLMVVLIGFYSGITGVNAVIAVAGANVGMILFGWVQELMNPPGRQVTTMLPFWFGTIVGLAPWLSIAFNIAGSETVPGFVYGIVLAQAAFFFSFGLNQWLQYRPCRSARRCSTSTTSAPASSDPTGTSCCTIPIWVPAPTWRRRSSTACSGCTRSSWIDLFLSAGLSPHRVHHVLPWQGSGFANLASEQTVRDVCTRAGIAWLRPRNLIFDRFPAVMKHYLLCPATPPPPPPAVHPGSSPPPPAPSASPIRYQVGTLVRYTADGWRGVGV